MKNLLTVTAIVFLLIFSAGLASAESSTTSIFPDTFEVGALYATNSSGSITTDNGAQGTTSYGADSVTLKQAPTTPPEPNFFYGTLTTVIGVSSTSSTSTSSNTFAFTANPSAVTVSTISAELIGWRICLEAAAALQALSVQRSSVQSQNKVKSLHLQGVIITEPGTTTASAYSFEGTLSD